MRSPFSALFERRDGPITSAHALWESLVRGSRSLAGVTVTEQTAMQVAAVSTCVSLISGTISTLPVDILERTDERTRRPAVSHPVRGLLSQPNGWQTFPEWLAMMVAHRLLRGNAYSLIIRHANTSNGSEQISELLPLHPDQVRVEQQPYPHLGIDYTWTSAQGRSYRVAQRDMLHLRRFSTNGVLGRSVIEDARDVIGVALATQHHAATRWSRGGLPSVVLSHPKTLSDKAKTSLEDHFEATYGGGTDQRRVAVIEEGMTLTPLTVNETDAQFLETRKFQRGEIAGLFHVPPHLIGDTEKSTSWGSGIEQQFIGWLVTGLGPDIVNLETRLGLSLITNRDRFYIKFFVNGLMRGDMAARGQWYRLMREIGAFSANDVLALEDMNPVAGGDTRLQPMNLAPLGWVPPAADPDALKRQAEFDAMLARVAALEHRPTQQIDVHQAPVTIAEGAVQHHASLLVPTVAVASVRKTVTRDANGQIASVTEEHTAAPVSPARQHRKE